MDFRYKFRIPYTYRILTEHAHISNQIINSHFFDLSNPGVHNLNRFTLENVVFHT